MNAACCHTCEITNTVHWNFTTLLDCVPHNSATQEVDILWKKWRPMSRSNLEAMCRTQVTKSTCVFLPDVPEVSDFYIITIHIQFLFYYITTVQTGSLKCPLWECWSWFFIVWIAFVNGRFKEGRGGVVHAATNSISYANGCQNCWRETQFQLCQNHCRWSRCFEPWALVLLAWLPPCLTPSYKLLGPPLPFVTLDQNTVRLDCVVTDNEPARSISLCSVL